MLGLVNPASFSLGAVAAANLAPVVNSEAAAAAATAATKLSGVVTADLMNGVLDEVIGLLPVCVPVMISFIALRKGISFIRSVLHSA